MTILSGQTIRRLKLLEPMRERYVDENGNSGGLGTASYDLSLDHDVFLYPGNLNLAAAAERFVLPADVMGIIHDKSSLVRRGVTVQNTVADPGWRGFLTLELINHGEHLILLRAGSAVAQVVFHFLDEVAEQPYNGKYQDQERGPQYARQEM